MTHSIGGDPTIGLAATNSKSGRPSPDDVLRSEEHEGEETDQYEDGRETQQTGRPSSSFREGFGDSGQRGSDDKEQYPPDVSGVADAPGVREQTQDEEARAELDE